MRILREIAGYLPIWTRERPTGQRQDPIDPNQRRQEQDSEPHQERDEPSEDDRRGFEQENKARRTIFDFLYEEVDRMEELTPEQRRKVKDNLRESLNRESATLALKLAPAAAQTTDPAIADIIQTALPPGRAKTTSEDMDEKLIADQLHFCLEQNNDTTRKISAYLRAIRSIGPDGRRPVTLRRI